MVQRVRDLAGYVCSLTWGQVQDRLGNADVWRDHLDGHTREQLRALLAAEGRLSDDEEQWAREWCYGACPARTRGARRVWCTQTLSEAAQKLGFKPLPSLSVPPTPAISRNNSRVRPWGGGGGGESTNNNVNNKNFDSNINHHVV